MEVMRHGVLEEEVAVQLPDNTVPVNGSHENSDDSMNSSMGKSVYFDKVEGMWKCKDCKWTYKIGNPLIDHVHVHPTFKGKNIRVEEDVTKVDTPVLVDDHQNLESLKNKILLGMNASTSTSQQDKDKVSVHVSEVIEEDDEIELEFERAIDKAHTHTPYCPNCSRQITRVILRKRKRQDTPSSALDNNKSLDLLGCLSCFSIFIPSGECLNPFRIFRTKWRQQSSQILQSKNITAAPPAEDPGHRNITRPSLFLGPKGKQVPITGESKNEDATSPDVSPSKDSGLHITTPVLLLGPPQQQIGEKQETKNEQVPFEDTGDALIHVPESQNVTKPLVFPFEDIGDALIHAPKHGYIAQQFNPARRDVTIDVPEEPASALSEILRCILYGGLMELIASMSVVSAAAASDATTLNIMCIGLASMISGLFIFGHHLLDLKTDTSPENSDQQIDRYQQLLGRRGHFLLHSSLATLSFLLFGLIPPVVYGFAFRESDNKDYKIFTVAAASYTCILILATTRAYVDRNRTLSGYIKTISYYLAMAFSVSGVAYAVGHLVNMLMERLGWFEPKTPKVSIFTPGTVSHSQAWGSY